MNLDHIKKQFEMVKNAGTFVITTETVRELIEEVEHLQFENDIIRRNRTTQERKDFNRIKQLEEEIKTLKSLAQLKNEEVRKAKIDFEMTYSDYQRLGKKKYAYERDIRVPRLENLIERYEKALIEIIETEKRLEIKTVSDIAEKVLEEYRVERE